jgi:transcriptional regulator with XRE-family HTH domain
MKQTIITYLSGPRNYNEGVALYQRYGSNLRLKRQFAVTSTSFSKELLYDELRKLAGLTEAEYKNLPRLAAQKKVVATETVADKETKAKDDEDVLVELARNLGVTVDDLVSPEFQERVLALPEVENRIAEITEELEEVRSKYAAAPETVRKMIRLRERFPFLNSPDCPDELKILVADMLTAYGAYKAAFARLQELGDEESAKAAADCETVVTEYIENREI